MINFVNLNLSFSKLKLIVYNDMMSLIA